VGRKEMMDFLQQFNPVIQALIATLFTWGLTAAGQALFFLPRKPFSIYKKQ
jgi:zinc transporter, ZIP family